MTTTDIIKLKSVLTTHTVLWYPDKDTAREVLRIGEGIIPLEEEAAPLSEADTVSGDCAYLTRGDYLALEHCDLADFVIALPIPDDMDMQPTYGGRVVMAS